MEVSLLVNKTSRKGIALSDWRKGLGCIEVVEALGHDGRPHEYVTNIPEAHTARTVFCQVAIQFCEMLQADVADFGFTNFPFNSMRLFSCTSIFG
jgi:hypothetical protein